MEKIQAYFVGYRYFKSKAGKDCYVLDFLTSPVFNADQSVLTSQVVSVFTDVDKYETIKSSYSPMQTIDLEYTISGTKVYYSV